MGDRFVKQVAYPAAIGCGCLLGGGASQVSAAEWSMTPLYSASVDYDSNRRLLASDESASEAGVLTADLRFKRALETADISIEPRYSFRRYSDSSYGNGDDRSLYASLNHMGDRIGINVTASIWEQSTLLTELLETGILNTNTQRRMGQAGVNWTLAQTERRALVAQLAYSDVSYRGDARFLLPGYRYLSESLGERFNFSEFGSFTASAFGSLLSSDTRGNSSHEYGLQAAVTYSFSERTRLDASVGESARLLAGERSRGTDAAVSLTRDLTLGNISLSYNRSLVPYGTGFLAERQLVRLNLTRPLTPFLDGNMQLVRVDNNQTAVLLNLDRRSYDSVAAGLNWHPLETWTVSGQVAAVWTQTSGLVTQSVREWRSAVTLTWAPRPRSRSW